MNMTKMLSQILYVHMQLATAVTALNVGYDCSALAVYVMFNINHLQHYIDTLYSYLSR